LKVRSSLILIMPNQRKAAAARYKKAERMGFWYTQSHIARS